MLKSALIFVSTPLLRAELQICLLTVGPALMSAFLLKRCRQKCNVKSGWVCLPSCRPLEVPFLCPVASQTVFLLVLFCSWPRVCFVSSSEKPNPYSLPSVWWWSSVIYMLCKRGSGQGNNTNMSNFLICGPFSLQIVFSSNILQCKWWHCWGREVWETDKVSEVINWCSSDHANFVWCWTPVYISLSDANKHRCILLLLPFI